MNRRRPRVGDTYQIGAARFEVTAFLSQPEGWHAIGVSTASGVSVETERALAELEGAKLMSGGMGSTCDGD